MVPRTGLIQELIMERIKLSKKAHLSHLTRNRKELETQIALEVVNRAAIESMIAKVELRLRKRRRII